MAEYTKDIPFSEVNSRILSGISPPPKMYYRIMLLLATLIALGVIAWVFQAKLGMGVNGINHPVGWGTYITNFVFWVGIAHSGTLISAILFLVRSKWRDAVSRSTEAMTVIAVSTAGLFPLIHLGRIWVFYYIVPYPNQRDLYPNFMSPLVLDLMAILTYLSVSIMFFYFGLIPDAAAAREKFSQMPGKKHWRTKVHRFLSAGWTGALSQWRHYNRSYLYFAMLATPLVISVHSIVSWDFANSLLPGWHSTLFAPYFVAGAIHSGLAMALTLMIPMRKLLHLEELITHKHLHTIAKLIILTTLILAYSYIIEPFIEFFSGSTFHVQFANWRLTGFMAWIYYLIIILNVFVPLSFAFPKFRKKIRWLFAASLLMNVGMWFERYLITVGATAHDFMPHNWGDYAPTWVELSITLGTAAFFFFMFLLFAKSMPTISIADFKDYLISGKDLPEPGISGKRKSRKPPVNPVTRLYSFSSPRELILAVKKVHENGFSVRETFSPVKLPEVEQILGVNKSPVSLWTVVGGISGALAGLWLTVGSVNIYDLIVGGKQPVSLIPFVLVMFELTILFAALFNIVSSFIYGGYYKRRFSPYFRPEFTEDKYGLVVEADKNEEAELDEIIQKSVEKRKNED